MNSEFLLVSAGFCGGCTNIILLIQIVFFCLITTSNIFDDIQPKMNEYSKVAIRRAAFNGNLNFLKQAVETGNDEFFDVYTCSNAARGGHLDILKYLKENSCPWNEDTCSNAALWGHLECLKWAIENGCSWEKDTCYNSAVKHEHLDVLEYVEKNGYPRNEDICSIAVVNG